jgi:hypothetical protein
VATAALLIVVSCALVVVLGVFKAGTQPAPPPPPTTVVASTERHDGLDDRTVNDIVDKAIQALPPGVGGGGGDIVNIHRRLESPEDFYLEGKARGMTDEEARAYAAGMWAAAQEAVKSIIGGTVPPPTSKPAG